MRRGVPARQRRARRLKVLVHIEPGRKLPPGTPARPRKQGGPRTEPPDSQRGGIRTAEKLKEAPAGQTSWRTPVELAEGVRPAAGGARAGRTAGRSEAGGKVGSNLTSSRTGRLGKAGLSLWSFPVTFPAGTPKPNGGIFLTRPLRPRIWIWSNPLRRVGPPASWLQATARKAPRGASPSVLPPCSSHDGHTQPGRRRAGLG